MRIKTPLKYVLGDLLLMSSTTISSLPDVNRKDLIVVAVWYIWWEYMVAVWYISWGKTQRTSKIGAKLLQHLPKTLREQRSWVLTRSRDMDGPDQGKVSPNSTWTHPLI